MSDLLHRCHCDENDDEEELVVPLHYLSEQRDGRVYVPLHEVSSFPPLNMKSEKRVYVDEDYDNTGKCKGTRSAHHRTCGILGVMLM